MTARINRICIALIVGMLALGTIPTWAAKVPLDSKELKNQASHVVSGTVIEVTSKDQKSKIETGVGVHRDRVFKIKLKVKTVAKGTGVKIGDEIEIEAWTPIRRIPSVPGLQGHSSIPEKGATVTVHIKGKNGKLYKPILPNGIAITDKAKKDAK